MNGLAYVPADTSEPVLELTTGDLLRAAAADSGGRTALVAVRPEERAHRRWTYAELLAEAERCARWLLGHFAPGERITVWAPNIPEWVVLRYGAALAGLVLVTANPGLRAPEPRYVLEQSRSSGLAPHKTPTRWYQAVDLPLTGSGKIQKFRLQEQIAASDLPALPIKA